MLRKVEMRGVYIAALAGVVLIVAGCAPSRFSAPVESRTVYKSRTTTQQGASETRSLDPPPAGFYRVRRGDTLIGISLDHGVGWRELAEWNDLSDPNLIEAGQLLRIRPPVKTRTASSANSTNPTQTQSPVVTTEIKPIPAETPVQVAQDPKLAPPKEASIKETGTKEAAAKTTISKEPTGAEKPTSTPQTRSASSAGGSSLSWPSQGRVITNFADPGYKGIAFSGDEGDPVLAAGDGRVVYSGSGLRGYGNLVIVKHDGDLLTAYAHNRKILVTEGQAVKRGQKIAELGSTDSDAPKLHFEVRLSGKPVDPMRYLAQR